MLLSVFYLLDVIIGQAEGSCSIEAPLLLFLLLHHAHSGAAQLGGRFTSRRVFLGPTAAHATVLPSCHMSARFLWLCLVCTLLRA